MSGFLYFIPQEFVELSYNELGISHAFQATDSVTKVAVMNGPPGSDGSGGIVIAHESRDAKVGIFGGQTWRKIPATGTARVWCGFNNDQKPTSQNLLRKESLAGHQVLLGDGNTWECPIARQVVCNGALTYPQNCLPRNSILNDDGQWEPGEIIGEYAALWTIAERWHDALICSTKNDDGQAETNYDDLHGSAVRALRANYKISDCEASLLGIFSTPSFPMDVLGALIDLPAMESLKKKEAQDA